MRFKLVKIRNFYRFHRSFRGGRDGLMVSALNSGASGPGSRRGRGNCVVFLGKKDTLLSQCFSPPRYINGYQRIVGES